MKGWGNVYNAKNRVPLNGADSRGIVPPPLLAEARRLPSGGRSRSCHCQRPGCCRHPTGLCRLLAGTQHSQVWVAWQRARTVSRACLPLPSKCSTRTALPRSAAGS